jgi:hypothetical protein
VGSPGMDSASYLRHLRRGLGAFEECLAGDRPLRDPADLVKWFSGTTGVLLAALDTDPSTSAWTIAPSPTAGVWPRGR